MTAPTLVVRLVRGEDCVVVALHGELDLASEPDAHAALESARLAAAADSTPRVVLDLRGLEFIDSSGLKLVLGWSRRLQAGDVGFSIVRGVAHVQRPFASAGLDALLPFVDEPPA